MTRCPSFLQFFPRGLRAKPAFVVFACRFSGLKIRLDIAINPFTMTEIVSDHGMYVRQRQRRIRVYNLFDAQPVIIRTDNCVQGDTSSGNPHDPSIIRR